MNRYFAACAAPAAAIAVLALSAPAPASAKTVTTSTRDTLSTPFFPGSGNTNTDFAITRVTEGAEAGDFDGNTVEIGIKAKQRFFGQAGVGGSGTLYTVQPGFSPTSGAAGAPDDPNRAWWNFDFSIDLGERTLENTFVIMTIIDPQGDNFVLDFGNDGSLGSLLQNSWNIGFNFISTPLGGFEPFLPGDYDITFTVADRGQAGQIGAQTITARVVPTPAAAGAGLVLLGGLGALRGRRRTARD